MSIEVLHEGRGYRLEISDQWSHEEMIMALVVAEGHPNLGGCRFVVHDLSNAQQPESMEDAKIAQAAKTLQRQFGGRKYRHAVVTEDAALAKLYGRPFNEAGVDIEVFDQMSDAMVWADAVTGFGDFMDSVQPRN